MNYKIKYDEYVISFAYGRYITGIGGTDKAVLDQQQLLNANGISYICFYPVSKINKFLKFHGGNMWGIIIDGEDKGLICTNEIIQALIDFQTKGKKLCSVFIHHLNNISLKELESILDAIEGQIFWYLHDYMTICPWGGLIDSTDHYCGSSFPCNEKCRNCKKFVQGGQIECKLLIYKYAGRTTFIAPSEAAKTEWGKTYKDLEDSVRVIEHKIPVGSYIGNQEFLRPEESVRIGFVGYSRNQKGWKYWKEAIFAAHNADKNEVFYQFGSSQEHIEFVKEIPVDFKKSGTSMTDALRKERIHCAVLWSVCPETFSYTYYEAWASNCFILTNRASGNIAAQVERNGNGFVADNPNELEHLLCDEILLREMVNGYRCNGKARPDRLIDNDEIKLYVSAQRCEILTDIKIGAIRRLKHTLLNVVYFTDESRKRRNGGRRKI